MAEKKFFGFKGSGDVFLDILDDEGKSTGLQMKGNCREMSIKADSEAEELVGFGRDNYGQVIESDVSIKPHQVTFVFNQLDAELFAMAFSGVSLGLSQSAESLTDEEITLFEDRWVECGKRMISETALKSEDGTTTYELGKDYEVNTRLGLIRAVPGGEVSDGSVCKFSCTCAAVSGSRITGATKANVLARIVVDGRERSTGRDFIFDGKLVRLASSTELSIISDKFVEASFSGSLQTPQNDNSPYTLDFLS